MPIQFDQLALVVHACDRYQFLFQGFHYFFQKYWGKNLPFPCYFLTEELDIQLPGFKVLKTGKGEWSQRLKKGLEQISQSTILFLQEDFWFYQQVNIETIKFFFDYHHEQQLSILKLHRCLDYKILELTAVVAGHSAAKLDQKKSSYLMGHQVSLWNKSKFLQQLNFNEHPWRNERDGTKRIRADHSYKIELIEYFNNNQHPLIIPSLNQEYSAYFTISDRACLNHYAQFFIDELEKDNNMKDYLEQMKKHLSGKLTHDGKPFVKRSWWNRFF
jgi:hypothetical protein